MAEAQDDFVINSDTTPLIANDESGWHVDENGWHVEASMPSYDDSESQQSLKSLISPLAKDEELGQQYEEILTDIGGFGCYQKCIVFFVLLPMFFASSFIQSAALFITATPSDHWCKIPLDNLTRDQEKLLLPLELAKDDKYLKHSECKMYEMNYTEELKNHGGIDGLIAYVNGSAGSFAQIDCKFGWKFQQESEGTNTLISEFGLVCAASFLATLAYILSSTGGALGIPLGGYLSDKCGRKKSLFFFLIFYVSIGVGSCFAPSYIPFVVLVCIQNIAANPIYFIPYMIGLEILVPSARATYSVLLTVAYTLGGVVFTGLAYLVRDWRLLLFGSTAPFGLFIVYWFVMPESPRWLLSIGKYDAVEKFLRKVAKFNGKEYNICSQDKYQRLRDCYENAQRMPRCDRKKVSWLDLLKSPNMRRKTLLTTYLSCNVNLCYSGLNFYAPSLGSDPYLSFLLVGLVELPSSLLTQIIADRLGRRLTMVVCFVLGSIACIATVAIPTHGVSTYPLLLTLFLIAKLFITSAYTVQELMVYELYPTVLRGEGVSFTNIIGYVMSNLGPMVVGLRASHMSFPMLVFGSVTIIGIFCVMALPETLHHSLPETIPEAENFGKNMKLKDCLNLRLPSKAERLLESSATIEG